MVTITNSIPDQAHVDTSEFAMLSHEIKRNKSAFRLITTARRCTHLRAHDFSKSLDFLLHSEVWRKTTKNAKTFDLLYGRI